MTKVDEVRCDVCDAVITKSERRLQLRRNLLGRLVVKSLYWFQGAHRFDPPSGWSSERFDVCESCREEIVAEVRERVSG